MKKNLLNGLLVLAVATVGVGTFSSCKDDNGDELSITQSRVQALENEVVELKKCKQYCEDARKQLKEELMAIINKQDERIKVLEQNIINITASINGLDNRIKELEEFKNRFDTIGLTPEAINEFMQLHSLATNEVINNILADIQSIKDNFATKEELNTAIGKVKDELNTKYAELDKKAEDGVKSWAWIEANKARVDALATASDSLKNKMTEVETKVANNTSLIQALQGDVTNINTNITNLKNDFAALQDRVKANEEAIASLKKDVNKLFGLADRLNKLVTGIINQATTNPVFGAFNFPMNVRSNMLITYFGSSEQGGTFPSYSSGTEYNGSLVFTKKDMEMLQSSGNLKQYKYAPGDVLMNTEDGNAGMVFLTINPNNVDFTGINLSLVNSQDKESGMKLKNLKRSDKELYFGISRAANNGFYEAQATVDPSHVNEIAVKLEPGLKSAFKNALENRGKKDFAQLAKMLYRQVTDVIPANGLKAAWTVTDENGVNKEYAVYSNYDVAATAVAPLSFKFMEGQTIDKKLPIITPLDEFKFDKNNFTFDIDVPAFHINDVELNFSLDNVSLTPSGDIFVKIKVPEVVGGVFTGNYVDQTYNLKDDINEVLKQVEADVNKTIGEWNESIERDFKEALSKLTDDIEKQVDAMMNDVMGQIDSNLGNMIDEINKEVHNALGGYFDKANKLINKYNELADKINARLSNPNHYLQSMACYKGTDGDFHQISNSYAVPSPFKLAGGNAITIYLTTYSAEVVVPSFKKFIAVTNVWNEATGKSAQDGDAEAKALLIKANNQQFMNEPITGKQHRVAFTADKAGFTYEFVYSALDYRGWTSTRKYYVSVK